MATTPIDLHKVSADGAFTEVADLDQNFIDTETAINSLIVDLAASDERITALESGMQLLSESVVSATVTYVDFINLTGYDEYLISLINVQISNAGRLDLLTSGDNGADWDDAGSTYINSFPDMVSNDFRLTGTASMVNQATQGNAGYCGDIKLKDLASTTRYKPISANGCYWDTATGITIAQNNGFRQTTSVVNGVRFKSGGSNFVSGTFRLYGIGKQS